jgi:RNA polymerase-associated protein RTF1
MADLDAELLALAGGEESSGEESSPQPKQKSPSPNRAVKRTRDSPPQDMARKGTARPIRKARRRRDDSDDDQVYVKIQNCCTHLSPLTTFYAQLLGGLSPLLAIRLHV